MLRLPRRWLFASLALFLTAIALWNSFSWRDNIVQSGPYDGSVWPPSTSKWAQYKEHYPVRSFRRLPSGRPKSIPKIQYAFEQESEESRALRESRLDAVRESFVHAWKGYRSYAWGKDELAPISGGFMTTFGGWAATLVDSLDTLWIMGLTEEFDEAVAAVADIDFTHPKQDVLNVFETTIRYLGGLLSAYDLSGEDILIDKAIELGEMLYVSFDTENRMPVARWNWTHSMAGLPQEPNDVVIVAETGSLSLEFTRLSQLTGDPKYYDAISRISDMFQRQQSKTRLPGLWPIAFYSKIADTTIGADFSLGAMADSLYEYLPKQFMLLGGLQNGYRDMYEAAIRAAKQSLFFRPMVPGNKDILVSGIAKVTENGLTLSPEGQHLVCFVGGMVAIGAKIFNLDDMDIARKLVDGCIWAYESMPSGIMPEGFAVVPCGTRRCKWDEETWKSAALRYAADNPEALNGDIESGRLPPGFVAIPTRAYLLRPEAIESVFLLYRMSGDPMLQEKGWAMFQAVEKHTRTEFAHAALADVTETSPRQLDKMESFWTAETLKYFYLLFSEPDLISLDEYVFNTEAHPLKRPVR